MADANKLIGIRPDGSIHELDNEYKAIRWFVGNSIDFMQRGPQLGMYIDDEALLTDELTFNLVASLLVQYPVYGSAVVCHGDVDSDGNTLPPTRRARDGIDLYAEMVRNLYANAILVGQDLTLHPNPGAVPPPTIITGEAAEAWLRGDVT